MASIRERLRKLFERRHLFGCRVCLFNVTNVALALSDGVSVEHIAKSHVRNRVFACIAVLVNDGRRLSVAQLNIVVPEVLVEAVEIDRS